MSYIAELDAAWPHMRQLVIQNNTQTMRFSVADFELADNTKSREVPTICTHHTPKAYAPQIAVIFSRLCPADPGRTA